MIRDFFFETYLLVEFNVKVFLLGQQCKFDSPADRHSNATITQFTQYSCKRAIRFRYRRSACFKAWKCSGIERRRYTPRTNCQCLVSDFMYRKLHIVVKLTWRSITLQSFVVNFQTDIGWTVNMWLFLQPSTVLYCRYVQYCHGTTVELICYVYFALFWIKKVYSLFN